MNPKRMLVAGSISASLLMGGVLGATVAGPLLASAASNSPSAAASASPNGSVGSMPAHGTAAHEDAEEAVTGANATKAQAAAVKAVGGGTAGEVTSDFNKSGYEVTVTKSDGTSTEVHLDASFNPIQRP